MKNFKSYRDLEVWQKSMRLSSLIYQETLSFPKEELYVLTPQIRRCALSIPSNIAEGHARNSSKEFLYHISVAQGSLTELETQIIFAEKNRLINSETSNTLLALADEIGKMLRGLQKSLKAKLVSNPKPLVSNPKPLVSNFKPLAPSEV